MGWHTLAGRDAPGSETTRRRFLAAGAATVGGLAVGATGATAADPYPRVTTRGHFEVSWGDVDLTDGNTRFNYETEGAIPGLDTGAGDELLVFAHGWRNDESDAIDTFETGERALATNGYDRPVIGYSWDADTDLFDWWDATDIAERNGLKLANFLYEYDQATDGVDVRLMAHSLGARVVLSAVQVLAYNDLNDVVTSLSLLGGAADNDALATDGEYGPDVAVATGRTDNFWKSDDDVLQWAYSTAEFDSAVGEEGVEGTPPSNYEDHNVDDVPDHFSYYAPDEGCIDEVVAEF